MNNYGDYLTWSGETIARLQVLADGRLELLRGANDWVNANYSYYVDSPEDVQLWKDIAKELEDGDR